MHVLPSYRSLFANTHALLTPILRVYEQRFNTLYIYIFIQEIRLIKKRFCQKISFKCLSQIS
jgi:hypothetical protein